MIEEVKCQFLCNFHLQSKQKNEVPGREAEERERKNNMKTLRNNGLDIYLHGSSVANVYFVSP